MVVYTWSWGLGACVGEHDVLRWGSKYLALGEGVSCAVVLC